MAERPDVENAPDFDKETERRKSEILGDIEETRAQMGETIDALQEKLSLSNISESIKDEVSEQVSSAVQTTKDAVYDNASRFFTRVKNEMKQIDIFSKDNTYLIPMGLIGFGVGLAIYNYTTGSSRRGSGYRRSTPKRLGNGRQHYGETRFSTAQSGESPSGESTFSSAQHAVSDTAGKAYSQLRDTASSAYETIGEQSANLKNKAGELATAARDQYDHLIDENPLALGAAAAALGVVAGLAIPTTSTERQYLGEASGNLISKAEGAVQDAVGQLKDAAERLTQDQPVGRGGDAAPQPTAGQRASA